MENIARFSSPPVRRQLGKLSAQAQLPAISPSRGFAEAGELFGYHIELTTGCHIMAVHIDKLLKGTKPAELPIAQPMQFKLIINLRTAEDLGLKLPSATLLQADELLR